MGTFETFKTVVEFVMFVGLIVFGVGKWVQSRQAHEEVAEESVASVRTHLDALQDDVDEGHRRLRAEVEKRTAEQSCADRRAGLQASLDAMQRTVAACQAQEEHRLRNLIASEVPKMLQPYMTRETTEAYLKGITERLGRIEGLIRNGNGGHV